MSISTAHYSKQISNPCLKRTERRNVAICDVRYDELLGRKNYGDLITYQHSEWVLARLPGPSQEKPTFHKLNGTGTRLSTLFVILVPFSRKCLVPLEQIVG